MGHTNVKMKICGSSGSKEVELLVDTGSTYTWVLDKTLKEIGVKPKKQWKFKTVDGRVIKREIGEAIVEWDGERATTVVVFAKEKDKEVLGVHAMEGLQLEVDPVSKKLKKVEASLAV
jgi:clan AA aspartic protease